MILSGLSCKHFLKNLFNCPTIQLMLIIFVLHCLNLQRLQYLMLQNKPERATCKFRGYSYDNPASKIKLKKNEKKIHFAAV